MEPGRDAAAYARFVSPGGRNWTASIVRSAGGKKSLLLVDNIAPAERPCEGLTGRSNQATDRMVISVPRGCINRPRSVRFGGTALGLEIFEPDGLVECVWEDDARLVGRTGSAAKIGTRDLVHGRRPR